MSTVDTEFPASRAAALQRLDTFDPRAYARLRNHLSGPVSRLSPYFTHGLIDIPEAVERLRRRHALKPEDKFLFELAWREYFQHVWRHLGEAIREPARPTPARSYASELPPDVAAAATGVPAIDSAIAALYRTGYLHNHQRLWLASYLVHLRKLDWRVGADWMYGYLLDGDLASNTLSWQWVAGTWTGKPYLFNAENVARYTPHSWTDAQALGTVLDRSYTELEEIARSECTITAEPDRVPRPHRTAQPAVFPAPRTGCIALASAEAREHLQHTLSLLHPWSLHRPDSKPETSVGMIVTEFHERHPWSEARWRWVLQAMVGSCRAILIGSRAQWQAHLAELQRPVSSVATFNPAYREVLMACVRAELPRRFFPDPARLQRSFSAFWRTVSQGELHV